MRKPETIERLYLDFDGFFASIHSQCDRRLCGWRSAAGSVKTPISIPVLTVPVSEISDEQAAERAGSSTDKGSFAALHYSADESASSCSNANIAFGRSASG